MAEHFFSPLSHLRSNKSDSTVRSNESVGVRQPAKSKIRRHNNNRLSTVFNHSPNLRDSSRHNQMGGSGSLTGDVQAADDPAELSSQVSVPGILKIFGSDICHGTHYKSVLATTQSSSKELVKEALERWEISDGAEACQGNFLKQVKSKGEDQLTWMLCREVCQQIMTLKQEIWPPSC